MKTSVAFLCLLGLILSAWAADEEDKQPGDKATDEQKSDIRKGKGGAPPPDNCVGDSGKKKWKDQYFSDNNKGDCWDLSANDCRSIHEAKEQCPCYCGWKVRDENSNPPGRGGDAKSPSSPSSSSNPSPSPSNPAPAPAPAPSPSAGGSSGGGAACFHGDSIVETQDGSERLADLVGRSVDVMALGENNQVTFSPIKYWTHLSPQTAAPFVTLKTAAGESLSLTKEHLIYVVSCQDGSARRSVLAENVNVNDCLLIVRDGALQPSRVVSKSTETKLGVYAPVTAEGSIVVDNVAASCYTLFEDESVQKIIFGYVETAKAVLQQLLPENLYRVVFGFESSATQVNISESLWSFFEFSKSFVASK